MCLVHVDVNIVASGCMAFARPSSAAVLGFSCIKLHTPDLEQVLQEGHNSRAQKRKDTHTKTTRHTSPQERARTDKHLNKNSKTEGSGRVQNQFKFKTTATSKFKTTSTKFQEHATNKHVMILSCRVFHVALPSFRPFWQLHHWIIVVP